MSRKKIGWTNISFLYKIHERSLGYVILNSKEKILKQAKSMFAESGFANVSMRQLAKAVEMSAASIYHHFPDKNTLYLETVLFTFSDKAAAFSEVWQQSCTAEQKLTLYVRTLIKELTSDREFHRLIQREIVDANPERMKMLAEDVFDEEFTFLLALMKEIAPGKDPHLSAISVLSLCKHHLEMQPISHFFPEWKVEHESPEIIADHIVSLLLQGLRIGKSEL